jgi:hypothetical protein
MDRPIVIFLHIPKVAGTTLYHIIERNYRAKDLYSIERAVDDGPGGNVEAFKRLSLERRAQIRMLTGHLPYGLHEYLPGPATYFTLLREPVDRVISFYYYVRRNSKHYLHDYALAHDMSLRRYVESHATTANDNFQVRMLSGIFHQVPYGHCTPDLLDLAKRNLQNHFAVVGLSEQFDATLLLLKRAFHWRDIFYIRQNVTADRPALSDVPAETLDVIREHNLLDIELYQYVKEQFEAQLKQADAQFTKELRSFRSANRRLQPVIRNYWQARVYADRAQELAARQSTNQWLLPLLRIYWFARQFSLRAWVQKQTAADRDAD